jgi:hypothetical protein
MFMARSEAKIPNELLIIESGMEEHNRKWMTEFRKEKGLSKSYCNSLEKFLRFAEFNNKPFNSFCDEDVLRFIGVMLEHHYLRRTTKSLVSVLGSFKSFLSDKYPSIFEEDFLPNLSTLRDKKDVSEKIFDAERLTLTQLRAVRDYNKTHGISYEYIFEVFFQLGIQKEMFSVCNPRNRDSNTDSFVYKEKRIFFNQKIKEILEKIDDSEAIVWNTNTVTKYLKNLTEHLRKYDYTKTRDFSRADIKASHDAYIFTCPICSRKFEDVVENWVLASSDICDDFEYHLVCKICRGKSDDSDH